MRPDLLEWRPLIAAPANSTMPSTDADHDRLTDLYAETGGDVRTIAAKIGRSPTAIWTKASCLGLAVDGADVRLRKCLGGCDRKFMSPDKGVRILSRCRCDKEIPWGVF